MGLAGNKTAKKDELVAWFFPNLSRINTLDGWVIALMFTPAWKAEWMKQDHLWSEEAARCRKSICAVCGPAVPDKELYLTQAHVSSWTRKGL